MAIVLVLAGTVGLSAAPAGATTVPRAIPVYSPDSSRSRYIVVAHDDASYESLRTDLIDADARVLEEYRDVIDGASVLLTREQVEALESDARVLAVDADEIFETSATNILNTNNDFFAYARVLSGASGRITDSNSSATRETNEPFTFGSTAFTKWYAYTPASSGTVAINTVGSVFDTVLGVFTGSAVSSLSLVKQDDDSGGSRTSSLSVSVSSGITYFIQVGSYFSFSSGAITLSWSWTTSNCANNPSNDNLACALELDSFSSSVTGSNQFATLEYLEPYTSSECRSVWYRFTPTVAGNMTLSTAGSSFDTIITLFRASSSSPAMGALSLVASNDDDGDSSTSFIDSEPIEVGYTYFVRITGWSYSFCNWGNFILLWTIGGTIVPLAPTSVAALGANASARVSWTASASNGGMAITSYTATATPGGRSCIAATGLSCVISGLTNGVPYVFTVVARNSAGFSPNSASSNAVVPSENAPTFAHSWGIDRLDSRGLATDGLLNMPGRGQGVRIYIVDTGIRATHSDFGGRVVAGHSQVFDGYGTNDCNGHGTHVASTAAGSSYGVANAAILVPVRVLDCEGSGWQSETISGLNWIAGNIVSVGGPAVVNMSLGGGYNPVTNAAVRSLIAMGVPVVAAAGNDGSNACYSSPASEPLAITVAASTEYDTQANFSNHGSCVDIFAPGVDITAAGIGSDTSISTKDGTSMAAPHVAGYAAVVRGLFPTASATAVAAAVLNSSTLWTVRNISSLTANRLLYVAATKCEVAAAMSVPCAGVSSTPASSTSTQSIAKRVSRNAPVSRTTMAKMAKITVPRGATISISVPKSRDRAFCRIKNNKVVAVRKGYCSVSVTVRAKGKRPITKSVRLKVVM
jgi:subtilisin family serine protease